MIDRRPLALQLREAEQVMKESYTFEYSLLCAVAKEFAWRFWTDVRNWAFDSDIESVELHGPFALGSRGVTMSRSSGRIEWHLNDVEPGKSAMFEIAVPGVVARFQWIFEDVNDATQITERVSIEGEGAKGLGQMLEQGVPSAMQKLSENMAKAAAG